jgi:hypothetical protein
MGQLRRLRTFSEIVELQFLSSLRISPNDKFSQLRPAARRLINKSDETNWHLRLPDCPL